MACKNCGSIKKGCDCTKSVVESVAIPTKPEEIKPKNDGSFLTIEEEQQTIVALGANEIGRHNQYSTVVTPIQQCPFNLLAFDHAEISHWAKKTLEWFYNSRRGERLSFAGLAYFAQVSLGNIWDREGREKMAMVKQSLKQFIIPKEFYR